MARQIFIVDAMIVDANGTYHHMDGFPATFDSNGYSHDVEKTQRRAEGKFAETWGAMCKVDTRQIQTVTLTDIYGFTLDVKTTGRFDESHPVQTE